MGTGVRLCHTPAHWTVWVLFPLLGILPTLRWWTAGGWCGSVCSPVLPSLLPLPTCRLPAGLRLGLYKVTRTWFLFQLPLLWQFCLTNWGPWGHSSIWVAEILRCHTLRSLGKSLSTVTFILGKLFSAVGLRHGIGLLLVSAVIFLCISQWLAWDCGYFLGCDENGHCLSNLHSFLLAMSFEGEMQS